MVDILDAFGTASAPERLEVVRLGGTPAMLQFFTRDSESGNFHWVDEPSVNAYVPCPGARCPVCYVSDAPKTCHLLPALMLERKRVGVLMVSMARGPDSLGPQLLPHLRDNEIQNKFFHISRVRDKYSVKVRPLGERADRCLPAIQAFMKAREAGLSLLTAFPKLSAVELAEVSRVRAKLDAMGGWAPPEE